MRKLFADMTSQASSILTGGAQFTSIDFTAVLKKAGIEISMDGQGARRDNVFVERLWRSINTDRILLH